MVAPVSPNEWQDTIRQNIRQGATFNKAYLLMNCLAAVIASYGLFANSPAVVIGAMVVATLLEPIIGVSMALVDTDTPLLRKSVFTLMAGCLGVFITSLIIGSLHRDLPLTSEIMSRTSPNLLDLMIALACGTAGAFTIVSARFNTGIIGVAIATALMTPLAASGILFTRGDMSLAFGALFLAAINLLAIQLTSSIVIWLSKFHHITQTSDKSFLSFLRQNTIGVVILLAIGVVLAVNFRQVGVKHLYETQTRILLKQQIQETKGNHLSEVRFANVSAKTIVRAVVNGLYPPSAKQVATMEEGLPPPPDGTKLELIIRFTRTKTINRNGPLYTDIPLLTTN